MKRNLEVAILALWTIALTATLLIVGDGGVFTYLGPVYFVCAVGTIVTVRKARQIGQ